MQISKVNYNKIYQLENIQQNNQKAINTCSLDRRTNVKTCYMPTQLYLSQLNFKKNVSFKGTDSFNFSLKYLNKNILGYTEEKNVIAKKLMEPFIESIRNPSVPVPASVLLYGPENHVMKNFCSNIGNMLYDIEKQDIYDISDISHENFIPLLAKGLNSFKNYNAKYGGRMIIYMEDPEKYLGMNLNQAKRLLDFDYTDEDLNILKSNTNNMDNINYFKSLLDNCSLPADFGGYATTFIFKSNAPHLIHPDLRKGKMEKIEIPRVRDNDAGSLLLYLTNVHYKNLFINAFGSKPEISKNIEKLDMKNFNKEQIEAINSFCGIHPELGAYSYEDISDMACEIATNTVFNRNNYSEDLLFAYELRNKKRSFSPKQIIMQDRIADMFNHKSDLYEQLENKEELGTINSKESKILNYLIEYRKASKILLEQKEQEGNLTEFGKEYLRKLKKDDD